MMVENWDSPKGYERQVLRKYNYMAKEAGIVMDVMKGRMPGVFDILVLRKVAHLVGVHPSIVEILKIAKLGASKGWETPLGRRIPELERE